jgi:hypothetical protein
LLDTTAVEGALFALLCWSTVSFSYTFHCRQVISIKWIMCIAPGLQLLGSVYLVNHLKSGVDYPMIGDRKASAVLSQTIG